MNRLHSIKRGLQVEVLSLTWLVVEAGVALSTGLSAHSVALTSFGADSVIEFVSGAVLLWRLWVEAHGAGAPKSEAAERIASWVVGMSLMALAIYILLAAGRELLARQTPGHTPLGLALALASGLLMPNLATFKRKIASDIGSAALLGDAACTVVCAYMAWTVVAGVMLTSLFGWWWADGAASLLLVYFVFQEGWEAIEAARAGQQAHIHGH